MDNSEEGGGEVKSCSSPIFIVREPSYGNRVMGANAHTVTANELSEQQREHKQSLTLGYCCLVLVETSSPDVALPKDNWMRSMPQR